jgi:succinate dehydrogenase / fumarate reductase, cytochrome b subunit
MMELSKTNKIPTAFIWRRVHSLLGFWLVLYLVEHLFVNSQAAFWMGDSNHSFIRLVNFIRSLPYLHAIEVLLIGIPLVVHGVWGVARLWSAQGNFGHSDGSRPSLPYARNLAYSWQRITSWILLFGIIGHVVQMRFLENPHKEIIDGQEQAVVTIRDDSHLCTVAQRMNVSLFPTSDQKVRVVAPDEGTAFLFVVRAAFQDPIMAILYTIFVLAAAFHAFNGIWTFLITWGVILSYPSQKAMIKVNFVGVLLLAFWGLMAIWGSR